MYEVPVNMTLQYVYNGQPHGDVKVIRIGLPVREEVLSQEGTIEWRVAVGLPDHIEHQKDVTVRTAAANYPVLLSMDSNDARRILAGEKPGSAELDLPLMFDLENGKEVLRDKDGRLQGVVDRRFVNVSWDRSPA